MTSGVKVPKVIAVIDDELEMEELYQLMLESQIKRGLIELKFFSDSRCFLNWYQKNSPDMILSDISMPYLNGPQIFKLIGDSGRRIPTYFVSGHEQDEYSRTMRELGVYRFISKPMNFNHVQGLIELDLGILSANL